MAGMPIPQPDPKQQLDAAHPIAPAAANQTSAAADLINSVTPQGIAMKGFENFFNNAVKNAGAPAQKFADGTANVQPIDVVQRMKDAGMYVPLSQGPQAVDRMSAAGMPLAPPLPVISPPTQPGQLPVQPDPRASQPGRAFAPPPPLPLSVPHAKAMFDNAIGATTGAFAAPVAPAPVAPLPAPTVNGMVSYDNGNVRMTPGPISYVGPAPHETPGTPEHTIANAHNLSSDAFVNALRGVPGARVMQIMEALKPPSMQEQAARLAVQNTAHDPGALQKMLIYLGLPQNGMLAQPGQGAVDPYAQ